ncbi:MAG: RNA polymerase sigma factor [Planctomycetota bacterium]
MTRTEMDLWRRWCDRRDQGAFRALVIAHEAFVYDFARRLTRHAADAEDLAQEAFLELAEADRERPPAVGLRAFLGRRVVLGAKMLKRASLTRQRLEPKAKPPAPVHPENVVENREAAEAALAELDPESRQALVLRFLHGLSYAEVAHVLGVKEGAARVRVHRGLGRLKERFGSKAEACVAGLVLFTPTQSLAGPTTKAAVLLGGAAVMSSLKKVGIAALVVLLLGSAGLVWRASRDRDTRSPSRIEATRTDVPLVPPEESSEARTEAEPESASSPAMVPLDEPRRHAGIRRTDISLRLARQDRGDRRAGPFPYSWRVGHRARPGVPRAERLLALHRHGEAQGERESRV